MSEQILKALMQLFAIVAHPGSNVDERRNVVESFLRKQLNRQLTQVYIGIFDMYYRQYQEKYRDGEKRRKHTSSSSVKLLVICSQINGELTQKQKFMLVVLLLGFIRSGHKDGGAASAFELDFAETIADALNFEDGVFRELLLFVASPMGCIPDSSDLLLIGDAVEGGGGRGKFLRREGMEGRLAVLHVASVDMYICRYEGDRVLFFNGQPMAAGDVYVLSYGCSLRNAQVKPVYYSDVVGCFYKGMQQAPMLFEVRGVEYVFENGRTGLHSVSFEVTSGNVVGIMGGSGVGKSTLLNVLTGLKKPTKGEVLLNGVEIDATEGLVGYVSQDDLLVEELTVFENLYFNACLCFGQCTDAEIRLKTDGVLRDLGLHEIRDMRVGTPLTGKISGGQRKRLNIALEIIRRPAVLFLDEPTSGLSSRDSDNIIDLLKEFSLKGTLVFVVIHQPSSSIFKMFDRLLVLDQGGYLIYDGNPVDAVMYFKTRANQANCDADECPECGHVNPEQIFNIIEARILDEHGRQTEMRRILPAEWHEAFMRVPKPTATDVRKSDFPPRAATICRPSRLRQFAIYTARNILAKVSDLQYIAVCLLEAPLLALLLAGMMRYYSVSEGGYSFELNENVPIYIFVAVIIAIFVGLSVSAEEMIKDRKMNRRESFLHLSRMSYLLSKTFVLFAVSALQAILFVWTGNAITGILHQTFAYWLVLFSAWTCANLMGLIISDAFKSAVTVYILIPFIVIPQLMLSGVLLRFEKINPALSSPASVPWYGELITARWAFEALAVDQFMNNRYEKIVYPYDRNMSIADFQKNYWAAEMKNRLSRLHVGEQSPVIALIADEIERENNRQNSVQFDFRGELAKAGGLTQQLIDNTATYLDRLTHYYAAFYNKTSRQKDGLISDIAAANPDSLPRLKSHYHNRSLANMVKNSSETYRIIEHRSRLLQNFHQIYLYPEHPFIKAHFYAPVKKIAGHYCPTYWVNVAVMWCFNIIFFIALYFRWLPRLRF